MADIDDPRVDPKNRYRHRRTGDLGYLFQADDGSLRIRYAHGEGAAVVRFNDQDWIPEDEELRVLHKGTRAQVAFAADQAYCRLTGRSKDKRRWEQLEAHERAEWCDENRPPMLDRERRRLYLYTHRGCMPPKPPKPKSDEELAKEKAAQEERERKKRIAADVTRWVQEQARRHDGEG